MSDHFDDDALWADLGPWHCGLCAQDTEGCECGDPLVLVLRVPGLTPTETDHDLVAMTLVSMLNDLRVEQYGGPEGQGPTPVRLLASGWGAVPEVSERCSGNPPKDSYDDGGRFPIEGGG